MSRSLVEAYEEKLRQRERTIRELVNQGAELQEALEESRAARRNLREGYKQMEDALRRIRDLRPNSGSSLDACIDIAREALDEEDFGGHDMTANS